MTYAIKEGYCHRATTNYWDDTHLRDEWQREVYLMAYALAVGNNLKTVLDVGCGSGFKLVNYFRDFPTLGVDVEPTLSFLQREYPKKRWCTPEQCPDELFDLVICADVIEHVLDPDALCRFIKSRALCYAVISTPDRDLYPSEIRDSNGNGPPYNECHVREWNFQEFRAYLETHFRVLGHRVSNWGQTTQVAICEVR